MLVSTSHCCYLPGLGSAGSQVGVAAGSGVMAVGNAMIIAGSLTGPAAPLVMAVGALITLGATIAGALHIGEGCGPTCVQATSVVNQAEPTFKMNVDYYNTGKIDQTTALNNFDQMWAAIQQACGGIPGVAGQNCVGDRQAGACHWKDANGQCWNWDIGYRQPLLQPSATPMSTNVVGSTGSSIISSLGSPLLIGGIALAVGLLMAGSD